MKKFLLIAALALMGVANVAQSHGRIPVHDAPDIGMEVLCTPTVQMNAAYSPMTESCVTSCGFFSRDILDIVGTISYEQESAVRIPMLKPEDVQMPRLLCKLRLWHPPVEQACWDNHLTAAMKNPLQYTIRSVTSVPENIRASGNPEINL